MHFTLSGTYRTIFQRIRTTQNAATWPDGLTDIGILFMISSCPIIYTERKYYCSGDTSPRIAVSRRAMMHSSMGRIPNPGYFRRIGIVPMSAIAISRTHRAVTLPHRVHRNNSLVAWKVSQILRDCFIQHILSKNAFFSAVSVSPPPPNQSPVPLNEAPLQLPVAAPGSMPTSNARAKPEDSRMIAYLGMFLFVFSKING